MTVPAAFRSVVLQLLAADRLTPDEASELLDDVAGVAEAAAGPALLFQPAEVQPTPTPDVLIIEVSSISLTVLYDPSAKEPVLNSSREGALELHSTPNGWHLKRVETVENGWGKLLAGNIDAVASFTKAMLTVPFTPERVQITVDGGQVVLPKVIGELQATVRGGTLSAEVVRGTARVSVNGGNLTIEQAHGLMANVNGGNLRWAGELREGTHFAEVNGGQATLLLREGSDVRLAAQVSMGSFSADFPTEKTGRFMNAKYQGQLGNGNAQLALKVTAGQVKVESAAEVTP